MFCLLGIALKWSSPLETGLQTFPSAAGAQQGFSWGLLGNKATVNSQMSSDLDMYHGGHSFILILNLETLIALIHPNCAFLNGLPEANTDSTICDLDHGLKLNQ